MSNLPGDNTRKGQAGIVGKGGFGDRTGKANFPKPAGTGKVSSVFSQGMGAKEKERMAQERTEGIEEIRREIELSKEEKEAGVEEIKETIDLPEKVKKETGMEEVGEGVGASQGGLTVSLPLNDDQIKKAKRKKVVDSILWLAYWCLRQVKILKKRGRNFVLGENG